MPSLQDENFGHSVTLISHHDDDGAMGIIINQPLQLSVAELFSDAGLPTENLRHPADFIWHGGPVRMDHVFALHDASHEWDHTIQIGDELRLTTSADFLEALAEGEKIDHYLLALGYAGWASSQLELEMSENSWVYAAADKQVIFKTAIEKRWEAAANLAGIDLNKMSYYSGNA